MATFLLIRHAEPAIRGVFLGQMDPPLSARGKQQTTDLASLKEGKENMIVYSSPLRRALQTASGLRFHELVILPDLREVDMGEWTGKQWAEIEVEWGSVARKKSADWLGIPAPGGETWKDLTTRVGRAWKKIRSGPEPFAVVAHQGVNAALAHVITGADPNKFHQQYGEVIHMEYATD
jgi:broad specificity phosphatase PhoE